MIFSQLSSKDRNMNDPSKKSRCELIASYGRRVNNGYGDGKNAYRVRSEVWAFAASLNWLALRTAFYSLTLTSSKMDLTLHPIRTALNSNSLIAI
jgi:hypothetical protein